MLISAITADPSIQPREGLSPCKLKEFIEILEGGDNLAPVTIFCDGQINWLADGFHRYESYLRAGRSEIPAKVHQGTFRDAVLCGIKSNAQHGLGLSLNERRNAVWRLLSDPEWHDWSSRKIGLICRIDHEAVERIKKKHSLQSVSGGNRQIQLVTNCSEQDPGNEKIEMLQSVSGGFRQIQLVTNCSEPTPDIRRYTKNGEDRTMDVSKHKSRGRSKKTASTPPPNVINIPAQTIHEALPPSPNKISGAFCVHKVAFEEPLFSDNLIEWSFKVTTSGPTYGLPYILEMMRSFPLFAQENFRHARKLKDQTNGTA